jgi:hypothetical protein
MLQRWRLAARNRMEGVLRRVVDERLEAHAAERRAEAAQQSAKQDEALGEIRGSLASLTGEVRRELVALRQAIEALEQHQRRDITYALDRWATTTTADFVARELSAARTFDDSHETLRWALTQAPPDGLALEFGVWSGTTLRIITPTRPRGTVFGFDSFEGLPEVWRTGFEAGSFSAAALPDAPGAELVVGLFEDTLPEWAAEHPESIAFLHLDADLYSSTATVLGHVGDRLVEGSIVVCDEYFNYPGWPEHEHRAWTEFVDRTGTQFTYEAYTRDDEQVVIRITKPGSMSR